MSFDAKIVHEDAAPLRSNGDLDLDTGLQQLADRLAEDAQRLRAVGQSPLADHCGDAVRRGSASTRNRRASWGWTAAGMIAALVAGGTWTGGLPLPPGARPNQPVASDPLAPLRSTTPAAWDGGRVEPETPPWVNLSEPELEGFLDLETRPGPASISI